MTVEESEEYNRTEMSKSASLYQPMSEDTLSHQAIEYMVNELTNAGIQVVITTMPHHPLVFQYLEPGPMGTL
jgi:dTDP-4-amino-4,6-dideoxygalactose transaminase